MDNDREVLVYKDLVIRESDLSILRGPCYLNDQIIRFYFSFLNSLFDSADILFVQPSVSFLLTVNAEEPTNVKEELVLPLDLPSKKLILFPINDCDDLETGDNGTHRSLLVFYLEMNEFVHHDSMEGANGFHAMKLYDAMKLFVGAAAGPSSSSSSSSSSPRGGKKNKRKENANNASGSTTSVTAIPGFKECSKTPQQMNGYDCGLYVMAIAREICKWHATSNSKAKKLDDYWFSSLEKKVDNASVELKMRTEVINLIEDLRLDAAFPSQ